MDYLIDTCVIRELIKPRPKASVLKWLDSVSEDELYLSAISVAELRRAIERVRNTERRKVIEAWFDDQFLPRFVSNILPLDTDVLLSWGEMTGRLAREEKSIPAIDSMIAATTLFHNLVLVTKHEDEFAVSGVKIQNPWKG